MAAFALPLNKLDGHSILSANDNNTPGNRLNLFLPVSRSMCGSVLAFGHFSVWPFVYLHCLPNCTLW